MSDGRLQGLVMWFRDPWKEKAKWKLVYVVDHTFRGHYGGISNWVTFQYVNKDGSLGKAGGCYDYGKDNFKPFYGAKVVTKIEFK